MILFSPLGEKYETSHIPEITRLKSQGYNEAKPTPTEVKIATGEKPPKPVTNPDTVTKP